MTLPPSLAQRVRLAHDTARNDLLAARDASGHWTGRLADSALAAATAVSALAVVDQNSPGGPKHRAVIERALAWLAKSVNPDGGWGDTELNRSNLATTMLVRAAFQLAGVADRHGELLRRADVHIEAQGGVAGLRRRYGKDRTFAVPILTNCALAGLVPWSEVAALPFEAACLPHGFLRFVRMPVVSYALPALVAIGQARYFHGKPLNPIARMVRRLAVRPSLDKLHRMQPDSGGFLEAVPLTSFVVMSLAGSGRADHPVVRRGVRFLLDCVRDNGVWPIDTNLATWTTTLAINALGDHELGHPESDHLLAWLLQCQHRRVHPFTHASPGGWGWTDLSGAVPDVDDTAGALLALARMTAGKGGQAAHGTQEKIDSAVRLGVGWLLSVQNADGGWPTFCRGWGTLPFDRSGTDLTAHALRALDAWRSIGPKRIDRAISRGLKYLAQHQRADGAWIPLWFGNEHDPAEENPVLGTARALAAHRQLDLLATEPARRGLAWLASHRNPDGGWGGDGQVSGVEETALAAEALLSAEGDPSLQVAAESGVRWLVEAVESGRHRQASPIGLYFARLWYHESLYPLIFTVSALKKVSGTFFAPPSRNP